MKGVSVKEARLYGRIAQCTRRPTAEHGGDRETPPPFGFSENALPFFFLAGRDRQAAQRRLLFSQLPPRLLLLLTYARSSRVFRNAVSFARCLFCAAPTQGSEILTLAP